LKTLYFHSKESFLQGFIHSQNDEPEMEDVLSPKAKKKKVKGQREEKLKDFPQDVKAPYTVSVEELDAFYGVGN